MEKPGVTLLRRTNLPTAQYQAVPPYQRWAFQATADWDFTRTSPHSAYRDPPRRAREGLACPQWTPLGRSGSAGNALG